MSSDEMHLAGLGGGAKRQHDDAALPTMSKKPFLTRSSSMPIAADLGSLSDGTGSIGGSTDLAYLAMSGDQLKSPASTALYDDDMVQDSAVPEPLPGRRRKPAPSQVSGAPLPRSAGRMAPLMKLTLHHLFVAASV